MPICWSCYWGWPLAIAEIYFKAVHDLDGDESPLHFGPGHIVWEDENFDNRSIEACLEWCNPVAEDYTAAEMRIIKRSLLELLMLPKHVRDFVPADYDGEHPETYPPPGDMAMIRI